MKPLFTYIFCLILVQALVGQGKLPDQDTSKPLTIKWSPSIGVSWRSDAMNVFSLKRVETKRGLPLSRGGGLSGIGLSFGIAASIADFGFEYAPSLLNDELTYKPNRQLTIDHQFHLFWQRKLRYSIGYVIFYDNTSLKYNWNGPQVQDIEYSAWAIAVAVAAPIKEIVHVEFKIMYARSGYPNNPDREAMLYGLRVFHTFRIGKKD